MHDEPNEQQRKYEGMERDVLYLLTEPDRFPTMWSVADIGREIDHFDPDGVVRPLCGAGLLHRTSDDFVFATPAAYKMVGLVGQVV